MSTGREGPAIGRGAGRFGGRVAARARFLPAGAGLLAACAEATAPADRRFDEGR